MRKFFLSVVLVILCTTFLRLNSVAQYIDRPRNNISLNIAGDASIISVQYERVFFIKSTLFVTGKIGFGYNEEMEWCFWGCDPPEKFFTITHHITGNLGKGRHFLELGLGGTILNGSTTQKYLVYPILGYRLHPLNFNKANFRIFGQYPFSGIPDELGYFSPIGLSVGISF